MPLALARGAVDSVISLNIAASPCIRDRPTQEHKGTTKSGKALVPASKNCTTKNMFAWR